MRTILAFILSAQVAWGALDYASGKTNISGTITYSTNQITLSFWLRMTADGSFPMIMEQTQATPNYTYQLYGQSSSQYTLWWRGSAAGVRSEFRFDRPANNNWFHLALHLDGSTAAGSVSAWTNGVSASVSVNQSDRGNTLDFEAKANTIGYRAGGTLPFTGQMAHVAIFSGLVPAAKIAELATGRAPNEINHPLIAYWPMQSTNYQEIAKGVTLTGNSTQATTQPRIYR